MNILVITETEGAVATIRLLSPLAILEGEGLVHVEVVTLEKPQSFDLKRIDQQDLIIFQRVDIPETIEILDHARAKGKKTLYDMDDNLFEVPEGHPLYSYFNRPKIRQSLLEFLSQVDHVTASTETLQSYLFQFNPKISVTQNQLDPTVFQEPIAKTEGGICRIGYAGGWTHEDDFRQVLPALKQLMSEYGTRIRPVFFWYIPEEFQNNPQVEHLGGTENLREYAKRLNQSALDIGLAPLAANQFNEAKSDEKFLEYASQKIAGIYSHLTPYEECVVDGQTGLYVESDDSEEWYEKIKYLIDNPDIRARIQQEAYDYVCSERNVEKGAEKLLDLYKQILKEPTAVVTPAPRTLVSIIIPVKNRLELTRQCLNAMEKSAGDIQYELIVIDNGSTDGTGEYVQSLKADIRYIYNPDGATFAEANNQGAVVARGEYLIFLNNDTLPQDGWLQALVDAHQRHPLAGTVGAKLLYPEEHTIQHAGVLVRDYPHPIFPYHAYHRFPDYCRAVNEERDFPVVTAACMLIKKALFHNLKGFDEDFINGYEDVDLCFRIMERGLKNIYTPKAILYHYKSQTPGRFDHVRENIALLQEKWSEKAERLLRQQDYKLAHYDVSIIMLTYNALEYTRRCVDSIQQHTNYPHEIVFVENGSTDGTKEYLRNLVKENSNYQLIENDKNAGFSAGNNQGSRAARGKYLLLLNNDVLVGDGWLENLVSALEQDERIGLIGPVSNHISGRQRIAEVPYKGDDEFFSFAQTVRQANRGKVSPRRRIAGFAMLIRKQLYDDLSGLDERFGSGNYEDDDLCVRVREAGYAVMVDESTILHHFGSRTFSDNQIDYQASLQQNEKLFRQKWPNVAPDWLLERDKSLVSILAEKVQEALNFIHNGDLEKGEELCREILAEDPIRAEAVYGLGLINQLQEHLAEARIHYNHAVSLQRDWAPLHLGLAMLDLAEGDILSAQLRLSQILERNPADLDARRLLGQALIEAEQFEEGIQLLMGILQDDPNDWQTHLILASLYAEVDRTEDVKRHLEAVLAANPDHSEAREALAKINQLD